ncbi:MAG TPA: hypothetical protein VNF75_09230 [Candidatus Dormibacteraeota bacterium]|nr:hypothetical protein [Candidatus Dormibacteraeota bacterium]
MASSLTSVLYRAARLSASARAVRRSVETGDPKYVARRARNIAVGRMMARAGVWKAVWGKW